MQWVSQSAPTSPSQKLPFSGYSSIYSGKKEGEPGALISFWFATRYYLLVRFLVLVTTMVTKVDHSNQRSNNRSNHRGYYYGYYDRY